MKTKPPTARFLSPHQEPNYPELDTGAKSRGHPNELVLSPTVPPLPSSRQPLPIELLAEERGQFLEMRQTAGARLHKIRVQGELSA